MAPTILRLLPGVPQSLRRCPPANMSSQCQEDVTFAGCAARADRPRRPTRVMKSWALERRPRRGGASLCRCRKGFRLPPAWATSRHGIVAPLRARGRGSSSHVASRLLLPRPRVACQKTQEGTVAKRILVPLDLGDRAELVIPFAAALAKSGGATGPIPPLNPPTQRPPARGHTLVGPG